MTSPFSNFAFMGHRAPDIIFKVHPELNATVEDVKMGAIRCPSCKEERLDAWITKQNGQTVAVKVYDICLECQNEDLSKKVTRDLIKKREEVIAHNWYHVPEWDESGFKNFETFDEHTEVALENAKSYARAVIAGNVGNVRITGTPGTGKTHLAKAIARTAKHAGMKVGFIEAARLFDMIKSTFGNDYDRKRLEEQFSSFDLMIIDDVGVETKKKHDEVYWTNSEWVRLVDLRSGKSTVYTSNYDDEALRSTIGARAESRMSTNAVTIDLFSGKDYRKRTQGDQQ